MPAPMTATEIGWAVIAPPVLATDGLKRFKTSRL
jgi:hypothetical protein